jgi:hypothetical protein
VRPGAAIALGAGLGLAVILAVTCARAPKEGRRFTLTDSAGGRWTCVDRVIGGGMSRLSCERLPDPKPAGLGS